MDVLTNHNEDQCRGFSLMETLLALAIMSVASLALFQSTGTLLRMSERTINAAMQAQDTAVLQKSFNGLVGGLVPAWPKDVEDRFVGNSAGFSGLTRTPFHTLGIGLSKFTLAVQHEARTTALVYRSQDTEWVLRDFASAQAEFSYLAADNVWYSSWPLDTTPKTSNFDDESFYDPPTFPLAIKLRVKSEATGLDLAWIALVGERDELPDLEGL